MAVSKARIQQENVARGWDQMTDGVALVNNWIANPAIADGILPPPSTATWSYDDGVDYLAANHDGTGL